MHGKRVGVRGCTWVYAQWLVLADALQVVIGLRYNKQRQTRSADKTQRSAYLPLCNLERGHADGDLDAEEALPHGVTRAPCNTGPCRVRVHNVVVGGHVRCARAGRSPVFLPSTGTVGVRGNW